MEDFNSKLESIHQVIGVLSKNMQSLNTVSRFQDHYEQLIAYQKNLEDLNFLLRKDITSIEKDSNDRRKGLLERTLIVIRIMQVFAIDEKKNKLQRQLEHFTSEYVQDSSDMELIKISKKIWLIANKHGGYAKTFINKIKSALNRKHSKANIKFEKKYGLIPEMILNIEEACIKFIEAMLLYQGEKKNKEKIAVEMKIVYKMTKKLLDKRIDKFALLFENKNPIFYKEYHQLRESQLQRHATEAPAEGSDNPDLLVDTNPIIPAVTKIRRKSSPKGNES